jgi:mycofactocin precursor
MAQATTDLVDESKADAVGETLAVEEALLEDVLVEEVSIDGMCGVY